MSRVLTGIQSTGVPHLGNILGAILPAIDYATKHEAYLFIADLHSLTQIKDGEQLKENTYKVAAAWLAMGLDPEQVVFYRQSDVPQVTELAWYLSCFFPYSRLNLAHSFKDKSDRLEDVNSGLFTYPMLMAADILLYEPSIVPVGKDQLQHIEFARDVAGRFNAKMGTLFTIPESLIKDEMAHVPGIDGKKMSKSYQNTIDLFAPDAILKKQVMSIVTDDTPLEEPKEPDNCTVFAIYRLLATEAESKEMVHNYKAGGYGYGHAKKALFELLRTRYEEERSRYTFYINDLDKLEDILQLGAKKARVQADQMLQKVRVRLGYI